MKDECIIFMAGDREFSVPNSWHALTPEQYVGLMRDLVDYAAGKISVGNVRVNHVCRSMGWEMGKVRDESAMQNILMLAEQVTFPFKIEYPDHDAVLEGLDAETYRQCKRVDPFRLQGVPIAHYLQKTDYRYVLDCCFCAQLLPVIELGEEKYQAYDINLSFGRLSTTLTALQFIEARDLDGGSADSLPLLAAVLYYPGRYSSEGAHRLAVRMQQLDNALLAAIAFNFRAFVNYLFTLTDFKLLTEPRGTSHSAISTGALEALYGLSSDGLGDADQVEHLNLIQYLTILRKKLIDSVRSLHAAKMELTEIEKETGLPVSVIKDII